MSLAHCCVATVAQSNEAQAKQLSRAIIYLNIENYEISNLSIF